MDFGGTKVGQPSIC